MKATVTPVATSPSLDRSALSLAAELVKARLTSLVLITTAVGFYMGSSSGPQWGRFLSTLVGTGIVAAAAALLNQWIERDWDARMLRTQNRPLPAGRIRPETVLWLGLGGTAVGLIWLTALVNPLTALLGGITWVTYLLFYTPLKRLTTLNTWVGAIPGALPPVMGWTAASGELGWEAWSLFALLATWQIPHFLAIAWLYREDYERGGFRMLPSVDPAGRRTTFQALAFSLSLVGLSLVPYWLNLANVFYAVGALAVGGLFLWRAAEFRLATTQASARRLFFMSIVYLPAILGLMLLTKN